MSEKTTITFAPGDVQLVGWIKHSHCEQFPDGSTHRIIDEFEVMEIVLTAAGRAKLLAELSG